MQSLDSSCQEADTIINDALLKLKGSSLQSNASNTFRQPHLLQSQQNHQYQTHEAQQPHHSYIHQTGSIGGLNTLSYHPPQYLFDTPDLPTEFPTISQLGDHELLSSVNSVAEQHQQIQSMSPPSLLSNIASIISPSPVVPECLLNVSPPSPTLNSLKPEKRPLLTSLASSDNFSSSNQLSNSSSPSKKPKLTNFSIYGEGTASSTSASSSILQPLLSSSSSLANNSNNVKFLSTSAPSSQQQPQSSIGDNKGNVDQFRSSKVVYSTSVNSNLLNHPIAGGSNSGIGAHQANIVSSSPQGAASSSPSPSQQSHTANPLASSSASTGGATAASSSSSSTAFFDIHDKIRELYLYLLIHDEKALKENRKRHRSRSFVLERLVEREKLNTIVLNLYPGNKGYSLAFYQDDNQIEALNDSAVNSASASNDCISSSTILGDGGGGPGGGGGGGGALFEGSGGLASNVGSSTALTGNSGVKHGTNGASSSRLKQTQISNNSLNNKNSNNLLSSKADIVDLDIILGGGGDNLKSTNIFDNYNMNATTLNAEDNMFVQSSSTTAASVDNNPDKDDDDNLVEVMSWPYEVDDLLNSIDKEELPIFISDLLETRIPNVFYSGCVICQVRDYRQTFPISSNSCDIYHVLLKPTNEVLYSDINQLSIDSDISSDDKLILESQLILATSEPLCLDPDPKIGRHAINSQHRKQMWNTSPLRRQMKKYSQISINRKRKIDQFTHHYGLELCDYLQRLRQRPRPLPTVPIGVAGASRNATNSNTTTHMLASISKLQKKPSEILRPIRAPNLDYPPLSDPGTVDVLSLAKAYPHKNREAKEDFLPVLIEEYTLESDRENGHVYLIKLSIYQRPATAEYLGELYVDRIYKQGGEHKGESCRFSLGTRAYANRYIQQFTEIFTEEGRKSVRIIHRVPGQPAKVSWTSGYRPANYQDQQKLQQTQQQVDLNAAAQNQQQQQTQIPHQSHHQQVQAVASISQQSTQPQPQQIQQTFQTNQIITPTLNATSPNQLPGNQQLNINLQSGNIVGITTAGNVQQLRQTTQQIFDTSGNSVNVQTQPGQQISLNNGSLVLVKQQPSSSGVPATLAIQTSSNNQQKAQIVSNGGQITAANSIRAQLAANVPILQAQLKAGPIVAGQHQQQIIQQKVANLNQTNNPNANTYVTGFMNVSNAFQQQQQQQTQQQQTQQVQVQQHTSQNKSANNAAILSLLNSAPAAMTSTPISSTFNATTVQQGQTIVQQQQQPHQSISAEQLLQQPPRKTNEVIQNLLSNNIRKINMAGSNNQAVAGQNRATNLIAVGLPSDGSGNQSVRVTMSALASQLASPPALMTNSNFGFTNASTNNNNNVTISNNNIKILNNAGQRIISASALRRDSLATAAPSPGSDSNASNTSGTSNLGFAMPGLNPLLATSPSSGSDQSQVTSHGASGNVGNVTTLTNQALYERLNSGSGTNTSSGLSPQQPANVTKNLVQHVSNVQSPAASISPMSSPPPQPSPQQVQVQQAGQTTTLTLQGINLQSLQGAMATFPGLQNVQVQIPGLPQTISLPLSNTQLASASGNVSGNPQGAGQQATSLLVSVPVTSTTQVNTMQTVPGGCGTVVSAVPATGAATQTVVLTNAGNAGNSQTGSMLSLPIAQLVASGVKGLNSQTLRTATVSGGTSNNVINANIIQTSNGNGSMNNAGGQSLPGAVNIGNSIQLLGTLQQRPRSIQVVGAKPIANRGQLTQRNLPNTTLKLTTAPAGPTQITTTANLTATPLVMSTQKLHLKLQKQNAAILQQQQQQHAQQQQTQSSHHPQQQQQLPNQQQQQHIQTALTQNLATIAAANQKRRRSATDVNK